MTHWGHLARGPLDFAYHAYPIVTPLWIGLGSMLKNWPTSTCVLMSSLSTVWPNSLHVATEMYRGENRNFSETAQINYDYDDDFNDFSRFVTKLSEIYSYSL